MDLAGTVSVGGQESNVIGLVWFDHQWGNFQPQDIGWDWFSIQLDDGTDVMLSVLFGPSHEPLYNYGTVVTKDGQRQDLAADEFRVQSTGSWTSPATGVTYPSGWKVVIPQLDMDVAVAPLILASEFDARQTTQNVYWEGDVAISGSHTGVGYVELTGYGIPATGQNSTRP
jgi:predicted secreted hydrolase